MRSDYQRHAPQPTKDLFALTKSIMSGPLEGALRELVAVRVSQINGCAHCIELHWKRALAAGVDERKLRLLSAYAESGVFADEERAALDFATTVTRVSESGVSANDWDSLARAIPDEAQRMYLLYHVIAMNAWNRLAISLALEP